MDSTKSRIINGIGYFREIKPSKFNAGHAVHLKTFLNLVEECITGKKVETRVPEKTLSEKTPEEIFQ